MNRHLLILCNPASGKGNGARVLSLFESFLQEKNIKYHSPEKDYPASLHSFTDLIVIGGDGTLNHVLNHYRDISIPITILRGGTGNDYCNILHGATSTLLQQFETAINGECTKVDAGECNGKIFINGLGIGFDGKVAGANMKKKVLSGKAAYYYTILRFILFYNETKTQITCDNETWQSPLFMLSAAKGKTYGGGFRVAPDAELTDGRLRVISISQINIFNRLRYLPVIERGKHMLLPMVKSTYALNMQVEAEHELEAHLDGEWMCSKQFQVKILAGKFLFRTPLRK